MAPPQVSTVGSVRALPVPRFLMLLVALILALGAHRGTAAEGPNQLSEAEKAAGWKLLFDGKTTQGWRSFKKQTFPAKGWIVEDNCLKHPANSGGGDLISVDSFAEFELEWEWSLAAASNSGLKYFVSEERNSPIGHEYQLLDPPGSPSSKGAIAGFYDVIPPTKVPPIRPAPGFNHSRVVVKGDQVEHWLNGEKTLEYTLGSDAVKAAVAASKFKGIPGFGTRVRGHILLQDHGGEVRFRNIRIRDLSPPQ